MIIQLGGVELASEFGSGAEMLVEKKRLVVELDVCEKEKDTSDRKAVTLW